MIARKQALASAEEVLHQLRSKDSRTTQKGRISVGRRYHRRHFFSARLDELVLSVVQGGRQALRGNPRQGADVSLHAQLSQRTAPRQLRPIRLKGSRWVSLPLRRYPVRRSAARLSALLSTRSLRTLLVELPSGQLENLQKLILKLRISNFSPNRQ